MPDLRASWYSQLPPFGWFDREDRPRSNALGVPDWQQGIALPSRKTLGQWFNVTPPGASIPYPMQQTDTGPAPWTGRGVDISAAGAHQMGYTPQNFPTNAAFKIEPRDEPRGLGSPAGMPVQAGDLPDNAVGGSSGDAYASGPPQGRKMPQSLMDMFQPQSAAGEPTDFGKALASRSNSLIGLGLGLLQPSRPLQGENAYTNAMQGYMGGAGLDARTAAEAAKLAHQKQAQSNFERTFARGDVTDFQKAAKDLGIKPGTPEHTQFAKEFYAPKTEQPSVVFKEDENGNPVAYRVDPRNPQSPLTQIPLPGQAGTAAAPNPFPAPGASGGGGGTAPVYGSGPGGFSVPSVPPSSSGTAQSGQGPVAGKTMREARAKAVIANEEDAVKSAKAAAEFKPALDEMTNAYEALVKAGGIGPIQGSQYGRQFQAMTGLGASNEALRQRYDTAKAKVQAQITAAQNKGEGAVSNFERKMYAVQFPELNAVDPATQLPFLHQLQASTHQTINAGRGTSLGSSPGTFERPSIEQPRQTTPAPTASAPKPGFVKGGYVFKGGDPSDQSNWAPVR